MPDTARETAERPTRESDWALLFDGDKMRDPETLRAKILAHLYFGCITTNFDLARISADALEKILTTATAELRKEVEELRAFKTEYEEFKASFHKALDGSGAPVMLEREDRINGRLEWLLEQVNGQ